MREAGPDEEKQAVPEPITVEVQKEAATRVRQFGGLVRAQRKRLGLTVVQVAEQTGIGRRFISELEAGKDTVQLGRALLVAEAVGLNMVHALRLLMQNPRGSISHRHVTPPRQEHSTDELPPLADEDEPDKSPSGP